MYSFTSIHIIQIICFIDMYSRHLFIIPTLYYPDVIYFKNKAKPRSGLIAHWFSTCLKCMRL